MEELPYTHGYDIGRGVYVVVPEAPEYPYICNTYRSQIVKFCEPTGGKVMHRRGKWWTFPRLEEYEIVLHWHCIRTHPGLEVFISQWRHFISVHDVEPPRRDILMRCLWVFLNIPDRPAQVANEDPADIRSLWVKHEDYCELYGKDPYILPSYIIQDCYDMCTLFWISGDKFKICSVNHGRSVPRGYDWLENKNWCETETLLQRYHNCIAGRIQRWWRRWVLNPRHPRAVERIVNRMLADGSLTNEEAQAALKEA